MEEEIDWQRLARHFAGETSPEEERELDAWIKADPVRRLWVEQLRRAWNLSEKMLDDKNMPARHNRSAETNADWERLQRKIAPGKTKDRTPERSLQRRQLQNGARTRSQNGTGLFPASRHEERERCARHSLWKERAWVKKGVAGVLVCLLIAGVATAGLLMGGESEVASASSLREVTTEPGERATIRMTDGTEITLNVDSKLRIADGSDKARRVFLKGEAFFDVASSNRPFVVHVEGATVNVHGTAFDVKSYPEERQVQVAVAEGVVSLHPQQTSTGTRLTEGQLGRISENKSLVATEEVDVKKHLGWTEGRIIFEDAALPVVARRLARWYDKDFKIADASIEDLHLTTRLNSSSLRDVMEVISTTLGIRYEVQEDRVLLKRAGGASRSNAPEKMQTFPSNK